MSRSGNILKKTLKVSAWVMLGLFLLAVGLVLSIRLPAVQTWIVQRAADYLSSELNTTVTLERIQIDFFRTVTIKGLYVEDLQGDTLISAAELNTDIELFSPGNNKIYLSGVTLTDAIFKLQKYPNTKGLNLNFIIDYFDSGKKDTTVSTPFDFNPGEIKLNNVVFVYRDNRYSDPSDGIDFEDMRVENIQASIDEIRFDEDTIHANIGHLSFREKSGFEVEYFEATARLSPVNWTFENLLIKTEETQLLTYLEFNFEDITDFEEFVEKVRINSDFEESTLSSNDIRYFAPELKGMDREITLSGKVRGTISQLRGRDLDIRYSDNTVFKGDISITGLPDFEESFFDLVVEELITDKSDIESIPTFPFTAGTMMILPDNMSTLGRVRFSGKFTGFLNDFVAYGNLNTALGYLSSDLNFKLDPEVQKSSYSGHLSVSSFDVGTLTGNSPAIGKTTFKAQLTGTGLSLDNVNAKMEGLIASFELNRYNYRNLVVNARIAKKLFSGELTVDEENLGLDFKGTIDLTSKVPVYNFTTDISHARLAKLNIIDRDSSAELNTSAVINISGTDFDNLQGYIQIGKTEYSELNKKLLIEAITFTSSRKNGMQLAQLESDILDFSMEGKFRRTTMLNEMMRLLASYTPLLRYKGTTPYESMELVYNINFKKPNEMLDIFFPELAISPGTTVRLEMNNQMDRINLRLNSDSIRYSTVLFSGVNLMAETSGPHLWVRNDMQEVIVSDTISFYGTRINGSTDRQKSVIAIRTASNDSINNHLNLKTEINYLSSGKILARILPSTLIARGKEWSIDATNTTIIDTTTIDITNLAFHAGNETVLINGTVSDQLNDKLYLVLRNFDTSILNPLLAIYDFSMFGIASGNAEFSSVLQSPGVSANMNIMNAGVYNDTLGDAYIDFNFIDAKKMFTAKAVVDRGGQKSIDVDGRYYILNPTDSIDFNFTFQKTNIGAFANYAKGLVSDVRGKASGTVNLRGPVDQLALNGKLMLQQVSFVVDYLNTRYSLSEEVEFNDDYFRFRNFRLNDINGNQALVDGYIYHDHLTDFRLKFDISARNFQMLNTNAAQNDLFYGSAYGSGNVRITGPFDMIKMNIAITTEKNTQIFIPLTNPEEISQSSFINFITHGDNLDIDGEAKADLTGIEMDFDLDVTSDAEIQLIFDSKIGDIIKGRGSGNIKLEITAQGDFRMFGNYEVYSGDYLFTLQNLVNKRFSVSQGGTIRWSGSPYNAEIDLRAQYKPRVSLYDLVQDSTLTKRIPVIVELHLTESLFNPTISFDIIVPDLDPTAEALIQRYISTEEEKRKQSISLIVLNRFTRAPDVDYQGTSSSGVSANAAELLSQQLSVWASQISNVINIGVNYRAADAFNREEVNVALSTRLFNDRIILDGNVGVSDQNTSTSDVVGDFNVEVKVSEDGRFRFKAFNKTIDNNFLNNYSSPYTQGIGVFYTQEFNTINELFRNLFVKSRKEEENQTEPVL